MPIRLSLSHFALLMAKCTDTRFDILAIIGIFLHQNMDDSDLNLDGFNFYRADREGMIGQLKSFLDHHSLLLIESGLTHRELWINSHI